MRSSPWRTVVLESVAREITVGYVGPMASEYVETGIPFLRSQNVEPLRINRDDIKFITPEFHARLAKSALHPGDVVIVRTGKPGACAVIPPDVQEANCSDLVIIRCGEAIEPRFLAYYVNTVAHRHIAAHLVGAVQQHFNVGSARTMQIALPEVHEQRAIVSVLSALDDKIDLNRRMNQTLEAMAQALFRSWFVDFDAVRAKTKGRQPDGMDAETAALFPIRFVDSELGKIPDGWRVAALEETCSSIFSGGTPHTQSAEYWGGGIPWLSSGETRNSFIIDTEKTITPDGVANSSTRLARAGCTVIASAGQGHTRGQTSLLTFDSYINQSVVALLADPSYSSDLFLFFDLERRYEQFRQLSDSHSSRGSLTTKILSALRVLVPPIGLVSRYDAVAGPIVAQITANLRQSRTLTDLRDTLLPKLLSGELRVGEAEAQVAASA